MNKAIDYDSFGVDDRPNRLSNVPDKVLEALLEEERENPPKRGKRHGSAALTGNSSTASGASMARNIGTTPKR